MKTRTIGTFSFIQNPNIKVIAIPRHEIKNPVIKTGFRTIFPKLNMIKPSNNQGVTKAVSKEWFIQSRNPGNFNSLLYDSLMEVKYRI